MFDMYGNWVGDYYNPMQQEQVGRTITKKGILDIVCSMYNPSEVVKVDEFESLSTRHICMGTTFIQILPKEVCTVNTGTSLVNVELVFCKNCRKLIINRSSIEIIQNSVCMKVCLFKRYICLS